MHQVSKDANTGFMIDETPLPLYNITKVNHCTTKTIEIYKCLMISCCNISRLVFAIQKNKKITVASTDYYIIAHDADSLVAKGEGFVEKKKVRLTLTVPEEMAEAAEKLKNEIFYNKSYAEMYRTLIEMGLKEIEKKKEK